MSDRFIEICNRLSEPWAAGMGISILETTVMLAVISGIWLVLRKRSSPQLGYLLFLLVPLRLLIPLEIHLPGVPADWSRPETTAVPLISVAASTSIVSTDSRHAIVPAGRLTDSSDLASSEIKGTSVPPGGSVRTTRRLTPASRLMLVWVAGMLFLVGRFGIAQRKLASLLRCAKEINPELYSLDLAELCRRVGVKPVCILESEKIPSPSVTGLFRPSMLLPAGLFDTLSIAQREWILLHELAHVRRRDLAVNCLQRIAAVVFFPNPALWLANRQINRLREFACDDLASALGRSSQIESSEAFLSVMKSAHARRGAGLLASSAALGMSRSRSQSECYQRMQRLLTGGDTPALKLGKRSLVILLLTAIVALPHLRAMEPPVAQDAATSQAAAVAQPKDGAARDDSQPADGQTPLKPAPYDFSVIVAEHVLLLDGKTITTWEDIAKHIEAVPEPLYAYPHFYITRGAMEAGKYEPAKQKIWNLHKDYNLHGHSEGSLWPRTDLRFDRIKTADDLKPDPDLRITGMVVSDGRPVNSAEVVLITPVDESIEYKTYHIALVAGRIRNRLDHVMTLSDETGQFTLYPPQRTPYYILALHPQGGFALVSDEQFQSKHDARLLKWGGITTSLEDPKHEQEADLRTNIAASGGRPEICINQYWSDLLRKEKPESFSFKHVPPIFNTSISRSFSSPDGGGTSLPAGSVSVLPGETRRIDFGEVTPQQRDFLKAIRTPPTPPPEQTKPKE